MWSLWSVQESGRERDSGRARQPGASSQPGLSVQKCCNNSVVCESAANGRPVSRSRDQHWPIRGDLVTSSSRTECHHHYWPQVQHLPGNEDGHSLSLCTLYSKFMSFEWIRFWEPVPCVHWLLSTLSPCNLDWVVIIKTYFSRRGWQSELYSQTKIAKFLLQSVSLFFHHLELEKQKRQENCSFISNINNIMAVNNSGGGSHIFVKRVQWNG